MRKTWYSKLVKHSPSTPAGSPVHPGKILRIFHATLSTSCVLMTPTFQDAASHATRTMKSSTWAFAQWKDQDSNSASIPEDFAAP